MTGYGRGESQNDGMTCTIELYSVNNRFLDIAMRLPRSLSLRETEIKEILRSKLGRGKITLNTTIEEESQEKTSLQLDIEKVQTFHQLLQELRKATKIKGAIQLEHLLHFSDSLFVVDSKKDDEKLWNVFLSALHPAITSLKEMRKKEGEELSKDLLERIAAIDIRINAIQKKTNEELPEEQKKLHQRISALVGDIAVINTQRLELEIALLIDKLDITEECVRFRSHTKFFADSLKNDESPGRKLNFLIQEMNREANTIGSKSSSTEITHHVVAIKEELEKVREQLQNIE